MFMRLFNKVEGGGAWGMGGGGLEMDAVDTVLVSLLSRRMCDRRRLLLLSWGEFEAGGVVIMDEVVVDIDWLFVEFESL
jgi:hypothetical protein